VKRSGRDEPIWTIWITIHKCMEATLRISLYSSLSQTSKNAMPFILSLMFSLQQNRRTRGQNRLFPEVGGGRSKRKGELGPNYVCMYVNVKNDLKKNFPVKSERYKNKSIMLPALRKFTI
jgi:hypothetical protein